MGTTARRMATTASTAAVEPIRTKSPLEEAAPEKMPAGEVAATKSPVEVEDGVNRMARTERDAADTATTLPSTAGTAALFASRMKRKMRKKMPMKRQTYRGKSTTQAWFTQVRGGLEDFETVFDECRR